MNPFDLLRASATWRGLRHSALVRDTVTTTGWNFLGRAVGFLIPIFLAAWFGVSSETDAFFFAYGLIIFAASIFAPAVENMSVPYIAEIRAGGGDVGHFVGKTLCVSGAGMGILAVLAVLLARPVLGALTRFNTGSLVLISRLIWLTAPLLVFLVWTGILSGYLNSYKKFAFPAVAPAFRGAVNLAVMFFLKEELGIYAVALGYLAGEAARLLLLLLAIRRSALPRIRLSAGLDDGTKSFLAVSLFRALSLIGVHSLAIVDKAMASWLEPGSVSRLEYAYRLYLIPLAFLSAGLLVTILSHWSERYYDRGRRRLRRDVAKAARITAAISLLLTAVGIIFSASLVKLAYGRGEFDPGQVPAVSLVWVCYLAGFLPAAVAEVFLRGHLTLKNTRVLIENALLMNIANICFNYLLMWRYRAAGIAVSTSLVTVIALAYLALRFYSDQRIVEEKAAQDSPSRG